MCFSQFLISRVRQTLQKLNNLRKLRFVYDGYITAHRHIDDNNAISFMRVIEYTKNIKVFTKLEDF